MGISGWRSAAVVGSVFALAVLLWVGLLSLHYRQAGDAFDFTRWEITTVANKWLFAMGAPLRSDPDPDAAIARYFALDDRLDAEARRLENVVEAAIEGRIDAVLREQGVGGLGPIPLPGALAVWPPVDVELAQSPRVVVTSPRSRIERLRTTVLRPDLSQEELLAIEADAEADDPSVSAIVLRTGGFATYPALISNGRSYTRTVELAVHEWTHHYLVFYPLGLRALGSSDTLTINETVADIVAAEVTPLIIERFGDPTAGAGPPASPTPEPAVNRDAVLRELRLEVEALLAEGRIEAAERRMEEVRQELWEAGVRIRRINQAYFAWFGIYAARADSVDPLGPQLRELRERAGSLDRFLEEVRGATSRADVERLLARVGG